MDQNENSLKEDQVRIFQGSGLLSKLFLLKFKNLEKQAQQGYESDKDSKWAHDSLKSSDFGP